jgi:hypothetical protein
MADRYKIVDESQSVHCCFSKTVVDTTRPVMIHGEHHDDKYEAMCECIDEDAAPVICDALNAADRFRWIPVSERLPDQGVRVLFFVNRKNTNYGAAYAGEYIKVFDTWAYDLATEKGWSSAFVTHWMPLPEPPEVK